jgi:hypothetical protein
MLFFFIMVAMSIFFGSDVGWRTVAIFWAVYVLGNVITIHVFDAFFLNFLFRGGVTFAFVVKCIDARLSQNL